LRHVKILNKWYFTYKDLEAILSRNNYYVLLDYSYFE